MASHRPESVKLEESSTIGRIHWNIESEHLEIGANGSPSIEREVPETPLPLVSVSAYTPVETLATVAVTFQVPAAADSLTTL